MRHFEPQVNHKHRAFTPCFWSELAVKNFSRSKWEEKEEEEAEMKKKWNEVKEFM